MSALKSPENLERLRRIARIGGAATAHMLATDPEKRAAFCEKMRRTRNHYPHLRRKDSPKMTPDITEFERALFARFCGDSEAFRRLLNWFVAEGFITRQIVDGRDTFEPTDRGLKVFGSTPK